MWPLSLLQARPTALCGSLSQCSKKWKLSCEATWGQGWGTQTTSLPLQSIGQSKRGQPKFKGWRNEYSFWIKWAAKPHYKRDCKLEWGKFRTDAVRQLYRNSTSSNYTEIPHSIPIFTRQTQPSLWLTISHFFIGSSEKLKNYFYNCSGRQEFLVNSWMKLVMSCF